MATKKFVFQDSMTVLGGRRNCNPTPPGQLNISRKKGFRVGIRVAESGANVEKYSDRIFQLKSASQDGDE
jgi:hypothetical protein